MRSDDEAALIDETRQMVLRNLKDAHDPRDIRIIAGAIRESAEHLQQRLPDSFSAKRLVQLCDELDGAINIQQLSGSLAIAGGRHETH